MTKDQNINQLPKDWKWVKLEDVCDKVSLNKIKIKQKDYLETGKFPVVDQGQDLIGGYYNDKNLVIPYEPPYIVFGDHTKAKKYINFKFIAGADGVKVLKAKDNIDSKFLFHSLFTIKIEDKGYARHFQLLEKELFPLPPKPTQQAIVFKIEELFSELDKGIENLRLAQQQLKTYRQSVLKWAFEGKLTNENVKDGELPREWKWEKISDIARIETGTTPSKSNPAFYGNEYPFYKPTDLEAGENVFKSNDGLTKLGVDAARYVPENSTLVTCIGATIGKTGLIKKGGGFNQQINAIVPNEKVNPKFIYYQTIGLHFQKQILDNASATTLPIINKGKFQILEMAVCPTEEQHNIVQAIESRLSVADKIEESITQSLQQAEALRQSILKKAFEGRLT